MKKIEAMLPTEFAPTAQSAHSSAFGQMCPPRLRVKHGSIRLWNPDLIFFSFLEEESVAGDQQNKESKKKKTFLCRCNSIFGDSRAIIGINSSV